MRVNCAGDAEHGYVITFECHDQGEWKAVASYPDGQPWTLYSDWRDSWYADPHGVAVQQVRMVDARTMEVVAECMISGHQWRFSDQYSCECGLIKIARTFEHLSHAPQPRVTLATRIRLDFGDDPRGLIPGSSYNGNPSSTLPGPKLSYQPQAIGLYEEHRLPIPMVNIESAVQGRRLYGTLLARPGKVAQGHKGDDHWWSLGLEMGHGRVDLLSVSGPVATNGMLSTIYGHRNGFDRYDDAYIDVNGPQKFTKTLYLDLGWDQKTGYSFRRSLWSAYELFQPVNVPHLPFQEAMGLKVRYAKGTFYREDPDVAGFCAWPWPNRHFQFGWCGGNIAIAYGLLSHASRTGDQQALRQATDAIDFYAAHSQQSVPGMLYGDYFAKGVRTSAAAKPAVGAHWQPTPFHGLEPAISSRQLGETLERLAESILFARNMGLSAAADRWQATLRRGCDFLARAARYHGMFPRAWNTDGTPRGWDASGPTNGGWLSTAGVYCVGPLVRMQRLTGERQYLELAEAVLQGYWSRFGEDLATPPWGGTHDAGAEDKEAGWGLMKAALDVYQSTHDPRYLHWAQLAADWTLTWMYFHDVGMPRDKWLRDHMQTVGWTFISTQNQEIDVFGFWMAPDYYRLGQVLDDERYCQIGTVLFDAATETIARDGAMFGQTTPGIQAEHYNHTNCTYVPNGPWRGSQHSMGIGWVLASTLYGGAKLAELDSDHFFWLDLPDRRVVVPTAQREPITWRYTFQQPPANWFAPDFDDTSWLTGAGGFGEYGTPGSVIGTAWDVEHPQIWIRRSFQLPKNLPRKPALLVHHDDTAQIYINGKSAADLSGYLSQYKETALAPDASASLHAGRNVLAATCQDAAGGRYIDVGLIETARPRYNAVHRAIVVDGKTDDSSGIDAATVAGRDHLWFGQGTTLDKWHGDQDLSYRWRAAWSENHIYFLCEVTDDKLIDPPAQPNSFLNDCIEILLDHRDRGGPRFTEVDGKKMLRGYEMHFIPSSPPLAFADDSLSPMYPLERPPNNLFQTKWSGAAQVRKTSDEYVMELGFSIPGVTMRHD